MMHWRKKMSKKPSEKKVILELNFEDGEMEEVEIPIEEYLTIETLANSEGLTFEEKFIELLKETLEEHADELI